MREEAGLHTVRSAGFKHGFGGDRDVNQVAAGFTAASRAPA